MNSSNDKIIQRIKSLLALGDDVSSPNEAAIALQRARKLMDKHQINFENLEDNSDDNFSQELFSSGYKTSRTWLEILVMAVANLNDCRVHSINTSNGYKYYRFSGMTGDPETCNFMMGYIISSVNRLYKIDKSKYNGLNKSSYYQGFAFTIKERINEIKKERENNEFIGDGRSLVVVKKELVEERFGKPKYKTRRVTNKCMVSGSLGREAGKKVHLGAVIS